MCISEKNANYIKLKRRYYFAVMSVFALFMASFGIKELSEMLPLEEGYSGWDIFGVCFMCFWILVVLFMGLFAANMASGHITISSEGVTFSSILRKETVKWSQIEDWGLTYGGNIQSEASYYLYFSKETLPEKKAAILHCKIKKPKRDAVKYLVFGDEYYEVVSEIVPYCRMYAKTEPFIPEN